jgi:pimeloyl-ACP methyl ester carboxylesterase
MTSTLGLDAWFASGQRVPLSVPGQPHAVNLFCRVVGSGSWVTLLHGFPTCSWDWAEVAEALTANHQLVMPDLLGFGDSDKPAGHQYTLVEQADLIEALWRHFGIDQSASIVHDIGGTVAQELLARQSEGRLAARLTNVVFLNGALYHGVSRPRPVQQLLAKPLLGPVLARVVTERLFTRNLAAVFSAAHPLKPDTAHDYWRAFQRRSSAPRIHRLLQYIPERERHHARWGAALEGTTVPLNFVWGMHDPVSGAPVADVIRQRLPSAHLLALDDVSHYPQLEVPERVAPALIAALGAYEIDFRNRIQG